MLYKTIHKNDQSFLLLSLEKSASRSLHYTLLINSNYFKIVLNLSKYTSINILLSLHDICFSNILFFLFFLLQTCYDICFFHILFFDFFLLQTSCSIFLLLVYLIYLCYFYSNLLLYLILNLYFFDNRLNRHYQPFICIWRKTKFFLYICL